jgi:outer membrane protein assembly factor BamB
VAYQLNAAHTGSATAPGFGPYFVERWRSDVDVFGFPIVADGKVVVQVRDQASAPRLEAAVVLDAQTGKVAWSETAMQRLRGARTYDGGSLYVAFGETLQALAIQDGAPRWSITTTLLGGVFGDPVGDGGVVYITARTPDRAILLAVDGKNGVILWNRDLVQNQNATPALSEDAVFVQFTCATAMKFDRKDGTLLWSVVHTNQCGSYISRVPVYHQGRLYVGDERTLKYVLNAGDGALMGTIDADFIPTMSESRGFYKYAETISGNDLQTDRELWRLGLHSLSVPVIAVNDYVVIGAFPGQVSTVDGATGTTIWTTLLPGGIYQSGLAIGDGLLFVPTMKSLVAFAPGTPRFVPLVAK